MIDDLMDSLVVNRPQPAGAIAAELAELCRRAEDVAPILAGFRNKEWVRIGTREVLQREPIRDVTRELADVAEAIVVEAARAHWCRRAERFGTPRRASDGRISAWGIVALGKLGGRELNYHGDLDLIFVFDEDGSTAGRPGQPPIPNVQFYADVARGLIRTLESASGSGPIYNVDARLRPHGNSGPMALPLAAFRDYYGDRARHWERLALTRARVLRGRGGFAGRLTRAIREALARPSDPSALAAEVRAMRRRLEASRGPADLKRGPGGLADVEFVLQYLQLRHADVPGVIQPNLWDALDALHAAGLLAAEAHRDLRAAYDFIRTVEGRLRLQRNRAVLDWPTRPDEVARLVGGMAPPADDPAAAVADFRAAVARTLATTRRWFDAIVAP